MLKAKRQALQHVQAAASVSPVGHQTKKPSTLDDLKVGEAALVRSVLIPDPKLRHRLIDMGLIPGTKVALVKVAPLGDPIEIAVRGYRLTLRRETAQSIELEAEDDISTNR